MAPTLPIDLDAARYSRCRARDSTANNKQNPTSPTRWRLLKHRVCRLCDNVAYGSAPDVENAAAAPTER